MNVKLIGAGIIAVITLIATVACWNGLVGYNNFENYQIYTSPTGSVSVIDKPGYYFKAFGKVDTYPRAMEVEFTEKNGGAIRATFNDGGTADISSFMRIAFPTSAEHRLIVHQQFSANPKNVADSARNHLANCIKTAGPVMSASENQASRKSEFNQIIEEQLAKGLFKMERTEIELNDLATIEEGRDENGNKITKEKKARVQATKIVTDKNLQPVVIQVSPLVQYGVNILQFSITEIEYDKQTLAQFAAKKDSYLNAEKSKAQRQEEVQQRLMVEEKGRRQVADVQAEENQKKERAIIQASQAAEVAVINKTQAVTAAEQKTEVAVQLRKEAESLKEIASIKAQTAELDKKAAISAAEARQKSIELGGGISEEKRVLAEIAAERDAKVATALAGLRVPSVVIAGGGEGKSGGLTENLVNMALLKNLGIIKDDSK
jgi:hypothetical protein